MKSKKLLCLGVLMLAGCAGPDNAQLTAIDSSSQLRMDRNKVVSRTHIAELSFAQGTRLTPDSYVQLEPMRGQSVQSVQIHQPLVDGQRKARTEALTERLQRMGVKRERITTENNRKLGSSQYVVEFTYLAVEAPDCPNWSSSPSSSFANQPFSNLGCATVTNIGQQVMYPEDLIRGTGQPSPDTQRNIAVVTGYHSNSAPAASSASEGSTGGTDGESDTSSSGGSSAPQ